MTKVKSRCAGIGSTRTGTADITDPARGRSKELCGIHQSARAAVWRPPSQPSVPVTVASKSTEKRRKSSRVRCRRREACSPGLHQRSRAVSPRATCRRVVEG
jgi:hypothetical protein